MNWNKPKETIITQDGSTLYEIKFEKENLAQDPDSYTVHANRYGPKCKFHKEMCKSYRPTQAIIKWDYDSCNLAGSESIEIHISELDDERFLLEGLIDKTKEALKIMESKLKWIKESRKKKKKKQ